MSKPPAETIQDLRDLVVEYFKQETLEPLKALRRYVGFGLLGGLLLGLGVVFVAVGGLRALQTETDTTFTGSWSWAPYAIVVAVLLLGGGLTWMARSRRSRQ